MTTRYRITLDDEIIEFEGPDNLSEHDIEDLGDKYLRTAKPGQTFPHVAYAGKVKGEVPAYGEDESSVGGSALRGAESGFYSNWEDELASGGNALIPGLAAVDNALGTGSNQQGPSGVLETAGDIGKGLFNLIRKVSPTLNTSTVDIPMSNAFWNKFGHNMDQFQTQRHTDEALHPTARFAGEVGGVASTFPFAEAGAVRLPQAVRAAAEAHPILTSMGVGGGASALSGAGAGRGNREQSAAISGLVGAGLGGTIASGFVSAPIVAQYAKVLLGKSSSVTREAIQQLTQALKRDGFDVSSPAGVQKLKGALEEYGGKPVSLADIGSATRARAGVGLRAPSEQQQVGIDTVISRQAGQPQRLAKDIRETVAPRTDVHAIDEDLVAQRASEAERLREAALFEQAPDPAAAIAAPSAGVERTIAREVAPTAESPVVAGGRQSRIIDDPELQGLARLPMSQKALTGALEQATAERDLLAATGKSIDHLPDLSRGSQLDMRAFDYLKRYLDDEVNNLYKRGQGRTFTAAEANQVKQLRDAIRERLRVVNPEYGNYLDAYKGSSEMIESLRGGQEFDKLAPEQIASEQGERSDAGQELYRVGAARNLLDRIKSARGETAVPANRILNSPEEREQLLATGVSPDNFKGLNTKVQQERKFSLLTKELQGSPSHQRQMAQVDAESVSPVVPFNPASGFGWAGALIRATANRVSTARNAAVNEQLLPRLLSQDPKVIQATIAELEKAGQVALARQIRRSLNARRTSAATGTVIGSPVSLSAENY